MFKLLNIIRTPFFLPHYILFRIINKNILQQELEQWCKVLRIDKGSTFRNFMFFIINLKEYRSVLYFRLGRISNLIKWYAPGMVNLYTNVKSESVGVGFIVQHGHSSRFGPERCGKNCQIWHNTTVGRSKPGGARPILGDNVKVCTNAMVLGDLSIGDNVTIAAGSVVVKSVPNNCLVVGNPAKIVRKDGVKVDIYL